MKNVIQNILTYNVLRMISLSSAIIVAIFCMLLLVNFFQTKMEDPLNSPALTTLMEKLKDNPRDQALKEQIRALDLLARKAYFTRQWQLQTGGYILLGFVAVLLISLKLMAWLQQKIPELKTADTKSQWWSTMTKTRKILSVTGGALIAFAVITAFLFNNNFDKLPTTENVQAFPSNDEWGKNWPNFRGPYGIGVAHFTNAPTQWDVASGENILWKAETPLPGFNSPIVWENKVFVSGGNKDKHEVYCYDLGSGELLWQKEVPEMMPPGRKPTIEEYTGYAAPGMATDGKRVFAIFGTGDIAGFDMNGNQLWALNVGVPENHYGHSSSLICYQNLVFVQFDDRSNPRILALDVASGKTAWEQKRSEISWASPVCTHTKDRVELILVNSSAVHSYNPLTGEQLWTIECMSGEVGPSVAYHDGLVFAANEYATGAAIKIPFKKGVEPEIIWEYDEALPNASSPLATADYIFLAAGDGYVTCLDIKTGELLWEEDFDRGIYASPVLVGDRVYIMDLKGNMHIIKASGQFERINTSALGEESSCTAAFLDGKIVVRGDKNLYCIGK